MNSRAFLKVKIPGVDTENIYGQDIYSCRVSTPWQGRVCVAVFAIGKIEDVAKRIAEAFASDGYTVTDIEAPLNQPGWYDPLYHYRGYKVILRDDEIRGRHTCPRPYGKRIEWQGYFEG